MRYERLLRSDRRTRTKIRIPWLLVSMLLLGCSGGGGAMVAVPTTRPVPSGQTILCSAAQLIPFTLTGDARTTPSVWGIRSIDGSRFEIVWPYGFHARFDPTLEVLDPTGQVVAKAGLVSDAGGVGGGDSVFICEIGDQQY